MLLPLAAAAVSASLAFGGGAWFTDVTENSGIPPLKHCEGVFEGYLDGDHLPDLFLTCVRNKDRLFLNFGGGRFADATLESGIGSSGGIGAAVGDFNGDGRNDLYEVRGAPPYVGTNLLLLQSEGGTFTDSSTLAGIEKNNSGIAVTVADFDGDGTLDSFVTGWGRNYLYRGEGAGNKPFLRDVTAEAGLGEEGRSWIAVPFDGDGDGKADLFVARGSKGGSEECRFYRNLGGGGFEDKTSYSGLGAAPWSLGAASADFDGDGDFDLYVAGFDGPGKFYLNDGAGRFRDATDESGILVRNSVGAAAGMIDGDLLPDLAVAGFTGPARIYRNLGGGKFADVGAVSGLAAFDKNEGLSLGDLDGDGDLDLYVTNFNGNNRLYLNNLAGENYVKVRFANPSPPPFGAVARLYAGPETGSFLSAVELQSSTGMGQGPAEIIFRLPEPGTFDLAVTMPWGEVIRQQKVATGSVVVIGGERPLKR
jgi:hypothetical protein